VHGPPSAVTHAYGTHLAGNLALRCHPYTGQARDTPYVTEAQVLAGVDHHLFHRRHMGGRGTRCHRDGQYRITHQLTGTVVGDVAAAIGGDQFGAQIFGGHQQVGRGSPHSEGIHVGMLEQNQVVVARSHQGPLQGVGVAVTDTPQPANP